MRAVFRRLKIALTRATLSTPVTGPDLSDDVIDLLHRANEAARIRQQPNATVEHLLWALTDDGSAKAVFQACGVDVELLRNRLNQVLSEDADSEDGAVGIAGVKPRSGIESVLLKATIHVSSSSRKSQVETLDLLAALFLEERSTAVQLLHEQDMSRYDATLYISHGLAQRGKNKAHSTNVGVIESLQDATPDDRKSDVVNNPNLRSNNYENRKLAELLHYLPNSFRDPFLLQWLCGCAVFPKLRFALTVEIGRRFAEVLHREPPKESELLELGRLRWFRDGRIPDHVRIELVKHLDSGLLNTARQVIEGLVYNALEYSGSGVDAADFERAPSIWHRSFVLFARTRQPGSIHDDMIYRRVIHNKIPTDFDDIIDRCCRHVFGEEIGSRFDRTLFTLLLLTILTTIGLLLLPSDFVIL